MNWLNYHHLHYFWVTAQEMSVTRAAAKLRLSQSTVSAQLLELERTLGQSLFVREKKRLKLTEAGRLTLEYANAIFRTGQELMDTLENRPRGRDRRAIRIGAVSFLSKNLQIEFVKPVLASPDIKLVMTEGSLPELLRGLKNHALDLVLTNSPARSEDAADVYNHSLAEMPAYLVGSPGLFPGRPSLASLCRKPLILPTARSQLRSEFESILDSMGIRPEVKAEVEDMALMRLFAVSRQGLALVPEIVVRNELADGTLRKYVKVPGLYEKFYAITTSRKFPNPWAERMVKTFVRAHRD